MNSKTRIVLAGAACIAGCAVAWAQGPSTVSVSGSSAEAADSQVMGPSPSPAYVWMAGHWNSEGGQWKWVAAHWDLPPTRSSVWVPGHWIQGSSGWVWVNGAWNVAEVPQSPATPPEPPGQPSVSAGQGANQPVPMPTTPAPNVAGQYGPPTETYYPPIDYTTVYPGYYWAGDAWDWGIYPFALGFGLWGPGYWGHGGWGYGRGHGAFGGHVGAAFRGGGRVR